MEIEARDPQVAERNRSSAGMACHNDNHGSGLETGTRDRLAEAEA